jgi:hypothetical protein
VATIALSAATVRAYRQTHYRVLALRRFTLHISRHSEPLQALHATYDVGCSAFVTASNPYSQPCSLARNSARHQALIASLARHGHAYLPAYGRHPAGTWPAERSVLVLGLTLWQAQALGAALQQNAIVWSGANATPQLILLR